MTMVYIVIIGVRKDFRQNGSKRRVAKAEVVVYKIAIRDFDAGPRLIYLPLGS